MTSEKKLSVQKFVFGSELDQVHTDDEIVYIKGKYLINREKEEDYSDLDTDGKSFLDRKHDKVRELAAEYDVDEARLNRKVFCCVVLPFCVISFIHYMTRFSIAIAAEAGLKESLHLTSNQYNIATAVCFIPYVIFEIFSNVLLKYVRPHYFMSFYVVMLGITVLSTGFVSNFAGLVVCRMFTGLFQSNSSALYYILANYYPSFNAQKVFTAYYSVGSIGGLLSYLLVKLVGQFNVWDHWRWLFVIEGVLTIILGVGLFFTIADFPEGARFLSDDETIFLVKKLEVYSGRSGYQLKISAKDMASVLKDPLVWVGTFLYMGILTCSYGYGFFEPKIAKAVVADNTNGIQSNQLILMAAPFILAFFFANFVAYLSDLLIMRSPFIIFCLCMALIGYLLIAMKPDSSMAAYVGVCLCVVALSTLVPLVVCWVCLNFGGHLRKNVATAVLVSVASTSGIFSSYLFLDEDAPNYTTGIMSNIGFLLFSLFCVFAYCGLIYRQTRKKTVPSYRHEFNNLSLRDKTFLGDKSPSFKYIF